MRILQNTDIVGKNEKRFISRIRVARARILAIIEPVSKDDDRRRQELILNFILLTSAAFLTILDITIIVNTIRLFPHYHGVSWIVFTSCVIGCLALLIASKRGYARIISYIIIGIYTAGALYSGWHWGVSLPATLLSFTFISIASSILIGSSFGFAMSGFLIVSLAALSVHEIYSLGVLPWKNETITATDVVTYSAILLFIAVLSWLSNREIKKSLDRAKASERALEQERDLLEIKVRERTDQLRKSQEERLVEISRMAEFGKLSRGLFHDLMTPLSSVALQMEKLRDLDVPEAQDARAYLGKAVAASHKMGDFMNHIRTYIKHTDTKVHAKPNTEVKSVSLVAELDSVLELLKFKTREADVTIYVETDSELSIPGNPMHFQRIFMNLLTNAIEAHEETAADGKDKIITITIRLIGNEIRIIISNNGPEIASENMSRIFEPFFSTKSPDKGVGVGLSDVKDIVETELGGSILVESDADSQTRFVISLPV